MKRLGIALIIVGVILLQVGIIGFAWFAGLDEGDRVNSYVAAQFLSVGWAVFGLVVVFIGYVVGTRPRKAVADSQVKEEKKGV